jgi:hypothetical protein
VKHEEQIKSALARDHVTDGAMLVDLHLVRFFEQFAFGGLVAG